MSATITKQPSYLRGSLRLASQEAAAFRPVACFILKVVHNDGLVEWFENVTVDCSDFKIP